MIVKTAHDEFYRGRKDFRYITWEDTQTNLDMTLTDDDFDVRKLSGQLFVFNGAGLTELSLPDALPGRIVRLKVEGTGGVQVIPADGDALSDGSGRGTADLYLESTDNGAFIELECHDLGYWDCNNIIGTWSWEVV